MNLWVWLRSSPKRMIIAVVIVVFLATLALAAAVLTAGGSIYGFILLVRFIKRKAELKAAGEEEEPINPRLVYGDDRLNLLRVSSDKTDEHDFEREKKLAVIVSHEVENNIIPITEAVFRGEKITVNVLANFAFFYVDMGIPKVKHIFLEDKAELVRKFLNTNRWFKHNERSVYGVGGLTFMLNSVRIGDDVYIVEFPYKLRVIDDNDDRIVAKNVIVLRRSGRTFTLGDTKTDVIDEKGKPNDYILVINTVLRRYKSYLDKGRYDKITKDIDARILAAPFLEADPLIIPES